MAAKNVVTVVVLLLLSTMSFADRQLLLDSHFCTKDPGAPVYGSGQITATWSDHHDPSCHTTLILRFSNKKCMPNQQAWGPPIPNPNCSCWQVDDANPTLYTDNPCLYRTSNPWLIYGDCDY